jgi:hypothetical protein
VQGLRRSWQLPQTSGRVKDPLGTVVEGETLENVGAIRQLFGTVLGIDGKDDLTGRSRGRRQDADVPARPEPVGEGSAGVEIRFGVPDEGGKLDSTQVWIEVDASSDGSCFRPTHARAMRFGGSRLQRVGKADYTGEVEDMLDADGEGDEITGFVETTANHMLLELGRSAFGSKRRVKTTIHAPPVPPSGRVDQVVNVEGTRTGGNVAPDDTLEAQMKAPS